MVGVSHVTGSILECVHNFVTPFIAREELAEARDIRLHRSVVVIREASDDS